MLHTERNDIPLTELNGATPLVPRPIPDCFILCGGLGTRLRPTLGDVPKPLAPVAGVPFLERLVRELVFAGCPRIILGTGFGSDKIRRWAESSEEIGARVHISEEEKPKGTAGALRNALDLLRGDTVLALNGDSFVPGLSLTDFMAQHAENGCPTSLVVVPANERDDAGSVVVNQHGRVLHFAEKEKRPDARYVSAGIYLLNRDLIALLPDDRPVSMEYDALPSWLSSGIYAYRSQGTLFDIGTPARLAHAQTAEALTQLGMRRPADISHP